MSKLLVILFLIKIKRIKLDYRSPQKKKTSIKSRFLDNFYHTLVTGLIGSCKIERVHHNIHLMYYSLFLGKIKSTSTLY